MLEFQVSILGKHVGVNRLVGKGAKQSVPITAILFVWLLLGGCATGRFVNLDKWVAESSIHCQTLIVRFAVDGGVLQSIIGPNFVPQVDVSTGLGTLSIEITGCESTPGGDSFHTPYQAGRVLVDLDETKVPFTISGIDRWDSYALHIAGEDDPSTRFMKANEIATLVGFSTLHDDLGEEGSHALVGTIRFKKGSLQMRAPKICDLRPFDYRRAIVGSGSAEFSLFFGRESGKGCNLENSIVDIEGLTPFSDLDLDFARVSMEYREEVAWDFTIWRKASLGLY